MYYPEVQSVPGLFLRVDAVGFGTTHRTHIRLVTLPEIYQLYGERQRDREMDKKTKRNTKRKAENERDARVLMSKLTTLTVP